VRRPLLTQRTQRFAEARRGSCGSAYPIVEDRASILCETAEGSHENQISKAIIGAAIEVHRELGPGLIEKVYEESLCREFHLRGIQFKRQQAVPIFYKGVKLASDLWLDLIVQDKVIVDNKAKAEITEEDKAQLLTYLRLANLRLGLLINFHRPRLIDGIIRVVNGLDENPPPTPGSFRL